jgi:hypothetical protein
MIMRIFSNTNKLTEKAQSAPGEQTLVDGIPRWMYPSVWEWVSDKFVRREIYDSRAYLDMSLAREVERTFRLSFGNLDPYYDPASSFRSIEQAFADPKLTLKLLDFLLKRSSNEAARNLQEILHQSGSKWSVTSTGNGWELVQRVEEVVEQAKDTLPTGLAKERLSEAWKLAYGQNPNPSAAYSEAIKAMEASLVELVEPNNKKATFGTIIAKLRDQKWTIASDSRARLGENNLLVDLCNLAWKGQSDRHATDFETFRNVTQADAELAISVALFVVHASNRGNILRNP